MRKFKKLLQKAHCLSLVSFWFGSTVQVGFFSFFPNIFLLFWLFLCGFLHLDLQFFCCEAKPDFRISCDQHLNIGLGQPERPARPTKCIFGEIHEECFAVQILEWVAKEKHQNNQMFFVKVFCPRKSKSRLKASSDGVILNLDAKLRPRESTSDHPA